MIFSFSHLLATGQDLQIPEEAVQEAVEDDQAQVLKKLPEKGDTSDLRQTAAAQTRIFFKTTLRVRVRLGNFMKNLKVTNGRHKKKKKSGIFH